MNHLASNATKLVGFCILLFLSPPVHAEVCDQPYHFGSFTHLVTGPNPAHMVTGDFNEDGLVDVAVTHLDLPNQGLYSTVAIRLGTGPGTFASPVSYPVPADGMGIVAEDFNEDGITDLAVACTRSHHVSILIGQGTGSTGDGSFAQAVNYDAGANAFQIVAVDFDHDGILDLATSSDSEYALSVFPGLGAEGVGDGTFGARVTFPLTDLSTGLIAADFDDDGATDLAVTENYDGSIAILMGTGATTIDATLFEPAVHYVVANEPFDLAAVDLNGDGELDLAVASTSGGGTRIMNGVGDGTFTLSTLLNSGNTGAAVPLDANLDGITDLAVAMNPGAGMEP